MQQRAIIAAAAVCGVVAFVWTLVARSPARDHDPRPAAGGRSGHPGAMMAAPPRTLQGLEEHVKTNPADFQAWFDLALHRHAAGLPEESAAWGMVAKAATDEITRQPEWGLAWYALGWSRDRLGDADGARQAFVKAEGIYTRRLATSAPADAGVQTRLGWSRRKLGDEAGARAAWETGEAMFVQGEVRDLDANSAYNLACYRALLGRPVDALGALGIAVERGYTDADWAIADEDLATIVHDPRFAELVQKMRAASARVPWQDGGAPTPAR